MRIKLPQSKFRRVLLYASMAFWLAVASLVVFTVWPQRQSAIDCTLTWGRLAPFPTSAREFSISVHGTMFTRAFRTSFTAPSADIEQWLQQSPGTREALPTNPFPGLRYFKITPGGGAQHAEVTVDDAKRQVSIYVYWS